VSQVPVESIALHIVRHLVRGLGKSEGAGRPDPESSALVDQEPGATERGLRAGPRPCRPVPLDRAQLGRDDPAHEPRLRKGRSTSLGDPCSDGLDLGRPHEACSMIRIVPLQSQGPSAFSFRAGTHQTNSVSQRVCPFARTPAADQDRPRLREGLCPRSRPDCPSSGRSSPSA
jgi:hypothetical protein